MIGILITTITAFLLSLVLVLVEHKSIKNNQVEEEIMALLPGYNCGACGFGSCSGMCKAMIEDLDNYKKCKPLKGEALKKIEEYIKNKN